MPFTIFASRALRIAVAGCNLMTWISSIIVVGITGYFLKAYPHDQHLIFEMCISAIVLGIWLPSFVVPVLKSYKAYYAPLNFIFSYLWLTAFVFAAQDYNESQCELNAPFGGSCNLKLTSEAFIFLAFFFTLVATGIDAYAYTTAAVVAAGPVHPEKPVEPAGSTA
ncbi:might be a transmembrane protein [Phaeosphaeriaceae sp. SRC1lsM3a]|nr:might be a transmembrane protein [Stagonospora sp. SRC1lsM3a]